MLSHSTALTGRLLDAVASELNIVPVLASVNASCCTATTIPIATVYTQNVANLSSAPVFVDGYAIQTGDIVGLAAQTITTQNELYIASVIGGVVSLAPLVPQPPDGSLLRVVRGTMFLNSLWYYATGAVSVATNGSSGTIVGPNGTLITYGPDPAGGLNKQFGNEAINVTSLTSGTPVVVWQFDCVARNFTAGGLRIRAQFQTINGTHYCSVDIDTGLFAGNPPTAQFPGQANVIDDMGGNGGWLTATWGISGNALQLTVAPATTCEIMGLVSFMQGAP